MRWLWLGGLGFGALVALARVVEADATARVPVTLAEALAGADKAPSAAIPGHEIAAAEASADAAAAWPSPSVRVGTNRLTSRLDVGVSIPLPVFGTVGAAQRTAAAEAQAVRADAAVDRRVLRHRVVLAWVALARAAGDVVTSATTAQHAAELERIARGRQSAGVGADVDVTVTAAARARADVAAATAVREEDAASAELAGVLGWDPSRPLRADGELVIGDAGELAAFRARLGVHPERVAAIRRVAVADAGADQVATERWPSLALEGDALIDDRSMTGTAWDRTDARVGVALDLPLFAHVGDRERAARARAAAERARLFVVETELGSGLVATYQRWQATTERLHALEHDVVPAQERAATLSAQAYREGARDLASALQAERDLAAVRVEVNAARADAAAAYAALQLAVGEDVGGSRAK
jgi:outer membrane protein TolC